MTERFVRSFAAFAAAALLAVYLALPAGAQEADKKAQGEDKTVSISDRGLRVLISLAWAYLPEEYARSDGTTVRVDKSDPNKFIVPVEDARRVFTAAFRTAAAQKCGLEELAYINLSAMMKAERASGKWTKEQLFFSNRLHVSTMQFLLERPGEQAADSSTPSGPGGATQAPSVPELAAQAERDKKAAVKCTDAQKDNIKKQVETYVLDVEMSLPQKKKS
ncbi:MAG: hypothetical protein VX871_12030 [Pseudomonadota bacterium]|nr:hypothetical protein [Pseudomonadota bacterium]